MRCLRRVLLALFAALCVSFAADALEVHFIDAGQADAVLIRTDAGDAALYDGGLDDGRALGYLERIGVEHINVLIASHDHADHIGGFPAIIERYEPPYYMDNGIEHTTRTYERVLDALEEADTQLLEAEARTLSLGDVELRIVPPPAEPDRGHNNNSVGVIVEYGAFRASLTGDAEPELFEWWRENHRDAFPDVHVHKASHHGSVNGDDETSMEMLQPETVVVSCGAGNRYGHPHDEALALYAARGADVYRTDQHGTVRVEANPDGTYEISPARDSDAGEFVGININTASAEELQDIIHIGPAYAEQIIELREERPFTSLGELTRVRGIGEGRLADIREQGLAYVATHSSGEDKVEGLPLSSGIGMTLAVIGVGFVALPSLRYAQSAVD